MDLHNIYGGQDMILGIDLGTTHSLACIWRDHQPVLIPNSFGELLTPSVVGLDDYGNMIVGKLAKERLFTHPHLTVANFKQYMGTDYRVKLGNQTYTSEELSSFVIRKLIEDTQSFTGEKVDEIVVSVPAYFSDAKRGATANAGKLAGVHIERIINEPSAAALSYQLAHQEEATYMMIDLGGGTLDVSVVDAFEQVIEIVAVSGDNHLGGEDFTRMIVEDALRYWQIELSYLDNGERAILFREAEKVKIALDMLEEVTLEVMIKGRMFKYTLNYQRYFELVKPLLQRIELVIHKALVDSRSKILGLEGVILVGGGSRLRVFREFIDYLFSDRDIYMDYPDIAIALGCGTVAGIKGRNEDIKDIVLTDICPFSLGIEVDGGKFYPIIERNTTLPTSRVEEFQTSNLGQKYLRLKVYQGESWQAQDNIFLKEFLVDVPVNHRDYEAASVRFTYDINGILEIDVMVLSTQRRVSHQILSQHYHLGAGELERRMEVLNKLKLHPRENEKNEYLLSKAKRLFMELLGEERKQLHNLIFNFEKALSDQEPRQIQWCYDRLLEFIGDR